VAKGAGGLTHFDASGRPKMVDVSDKPATLRIATAEGAVTMSRAALDVVRSRAGKKGDALAVAELAGVIGAKKTPDLIPLCHPISISGVEIRTEVDATAARVRVVATVKTTGATGVEMEALTAAATACLALYDMLKAVDRTMTIERVRLIEKSGGASGDFARAAGT
jgi:cyclic pyranopterin phosphate synthase